MEQIMTKGELIDKLIGMPDDATIFINADHGQMDEQVGIVEISSTPEEYWEYGDDLDWRGNCRAITAIRLS